MKLQMLENVVGLMKPNVCSYDKHYYPSIATWKHLTNTTIFWFCVEGNIVLQRENSCFRGVFSYKYSPEKQTEYSPRPKLMKILYDRPFLLALYNAIFWDIST